jgi:hypothetical protein
MKDIIPNIKIHKNKLIVKYVVDPVAEGTDGEDLLEVSVEIIGEEVKGIKTGQTVLVKRHYLDVIKSSLFDKNLFTIHDYNRVFATIE